MGFWQRAAVVLRANTALRRRAPSAPGAGEQAAGEQLQALQDIAERMAGMATTIKQLEEQAKRLDEEAEEVAQSEGASSDDTDIAERAHVQVEVIDEMLDGIRALRAAIDQQRAELIEAEQRLAAEGEAAREADRTSG